MNTTDHSAQERYDRSFDSTFRQMRADAWIEARKRAEFWSGVRQFGSGCGIALLLGGTMGALLGVLTWALG